MPLFGDDARNGDLTAPARGPDPGLATALQRRRRCGLRWEVRLAKTQDYDLGEFTFPRGWFVVADGADVSAKPLSVRYFGQDLVIFRGASGAVVMLDAYCPHMGTHFGKSATSWTVASGRHVEGEDRKSTRLNSSHAN